MPRDYRKGALLACCAVFAVSAVEAKVEAFTGNEFYEHCTAGGDVRDRFCLILVDAYVDGMLYGSDGAAFSVLSQSTSLPPKHFTKLSEIISSGWAMERLGICVDDGKTTSKQMLDVVLEFLKAHPELRHYPVPYLVGEGLRRGFPCEWGEGPNLLEMLKKIE